MEVRIYTRYTDPVNFERVSLHDDHIAVETCKEGEKSSHVFPAQEAKKWLA